MVNGKRAFCRSLRASKPATWARAGAIFPPAEDVFSGFFRKPGRRKRGKRRPRLIVLIRIDLQARYLAPKKFTIQRAIVSRSERSFKDASAASAIASP
jgi:hypothetical protein